MIQLVKLCPGVRPLPGDSLVYLVKSRSRKGWEHKVDFTLWSGFGACGCEWFITTVQPLLRLGKYAKAHTVQCHHLFLARYYLMLEVAQAIIQRREAAAHANQAKHHRKPSGYEEEACAY